MKTLSSAEEDFRANERDVNQIQDFWAGDVSSLYGLVISATGEPERSLTPLVLRWEREDRRNPGIVGTEDLVLELDDIAVGKRYDLPGQAARVSYRMATPAKGEGATASSLRGSLRIEEITAAEVAVSVDLSARMTRIDVPGGFDERIRGSFRLQRRPGGIPR